LRIARTNIATAATAAMAAQMLAILPAWLSISMVEAVFESDPYVVARYVAR